MEDFEMKVAKFGGTSLANADRFKKYASIILADSERKSYCCICPW
jgi:aspartokinase